MDEPKIVKDRFEVRCMSGGEQVGTHFRGIEDLPDQSEDSLQGQAAQRWAVVADGQPCGGAEGEPHQIVHVVTTEQIVERA